MIARRFLIKGQVQGVGFRYFAQHSAAAHQVKGWIRNLDDGSVEALVQGSEDEVGHFRDDIATGPKHARVIELEEIVVDPNPGLRTFRIER